MTIKVHFTSVRKVETREKLSFLKYKNFDNGLVEIETESDYLINELRKEEE